MTQTINFYMKMLTHIRDFNKRNICFRFRIQRKDLHGSVILWLSIILTRDDIHSVYTHRKPTYRYQSAHNGYKNNVWYRYTHSCYADNISVLPRSQKRHTDSVDSFTASLYITYRSQVAILPACTTATAHIVAFEFDLVMDYVATGVTTCDTRVYWKHVAWWKRVVKLSQYLEHPTGWMSFAWHCFDPLHDIALITIQAKINNCHPLPCVGCWNPRRKPIYSACQCAALFCITNRDVLRVYTC